MAFLPTELFAFKHTTVCTKCKLLYKTHEKLNNSKISYSGSGLEGILVILPPPSNIEVLNNEAGSLKDPYYHCYNESVFKEVGLDWERDIWRVNLIGCPCEKYKSNYMEYCKTRLDNIIKDLKPKLIIGVGSEQLDYTVRPNYSRDVSNILKWRGFIIPSHEFKVNIAHIMGPRDLLVNDRYLKNDKYKSSKSIIDKYEVLQRNGTFRNIKKTTCIDLFEAVMAMNRPIPRSIHDSNITFIDTLEELSLKLNEYHKYLLDNPKEICVVDVETNAIKPYNKLHKIYSIAICVKNFEAIAFMNKPEFNDCITEFLSYNHNVCGANYKFDYNWLKVKFGIAWSNIRWDTNIMAHLLDFRDGVTSLKFQTYIHNGVGDYENTTSKYLSTACENNPYKGCNSLNKIHEAPERDLLYYNALDTIATRFVMIEQQKLYKLLPNDNKLFAKDLFLKGSIRLADVESQGMSINLETARNNYNKCLSKLDVIRDIIKNEEVWVLWKSVYGEKSSFDSDTQVIDILITRLGLWADGISRKQRPTADAEFLSRIDHPFIKYILDYRKYAKMSKTYLLSYLEETNDDGKIRCNYKLASVKSMRGSSDSPNLQNQASRSSEAVEMTKGCFIPDEGCHILESDYKALEISGTAIVTGDTKLLEYLSDINSDMHADNAKITFLLTEKDWLRIKEECPKNAKKIRNGAKTVSFSFNYGNYYGNQAPLTWRYLHDSKLKFSESVSMRDHLISKLEMDAQYIEYCKIEANPIDKEDFYFKCFETHMKDVEIKYWENLKMVAEWRDRNYNDFLEKGYITNITGFVYKGIMSKNATGNYPIQSISFHIVLWCVCRISQLARSNGFKSGIINTIHDSIISNVYPDEKEAYIRLVTYVMTEDVKLYFKFLNTQLVVEHELTNINEAWSLKEGYEYELDEGAYYE